MVEPPHVDGLPLWAQITISLVFGVAALLAAVSGYSKRQEKAATMTEPMTDAKLMAAAIVDMGALRNLADTNAKLIYAVEGLCRTIDEHTHFERNSIELDREICQRLRELREELEHNRSGRWIGDK